MRVVRPDERPKRRTRAKNPKTLAQAIAEGDYLEILRAQRRDIAASLPNEKGPAKAALHRQLAVISKEIQSLESAATDGSIGSVVATTDDADWDESAI